MISPAAPPSTPPARLLFTELNSLGAESVWDLQVGASPRLATELYLPLSNVRRYFVAPHAQIEAHNVAAAVDNGSRSASSACAASSYGLDVGREFGNWGEIRGRRDAHRSGSTRVSLGDFSTLEHRASTCAAISCASATTASTARNFPRSGQALTLEWRGEENDRTQRAGQRPADGSTGAAPGRAARTPAIGWVSGGSTVGGSETNVRSVFSARRLPESVGPARRSRWPGRTTPSRACIVLRNVGSGGEGVLNVPAYAGLSLEVGNVWSSRSAISRPGFGAARCRAVFRRRHLHRAGVPRRRLRRGRHSGVLPVPRPQLLNCLRLQPAACGQVLDLLEDQRRRVARTRVLVPAAHLGHRRIALGGGGVPVGAAASRRRSSLRKGSVLRRLMRTP